MPIKKESKAEVPVQKLDRTPYLGAFLKSFASSGGKWHANPDPSLLWLDEARTTGKKHYAQRVYAQLANGFDVLNDSEKAVLLHALQRLARGIPAHHAFMADGKEQRGSTRERNRPAGDMTSRNDDLVRLVEIQLRPEDPPKKITRRYKSSPSSYDGPIPTPPPRVISLMEASNNAAKDAEERLLHIKWWGQKKPVRPRTFYDAYRNARTKQ